MSRRVVKDQLEDDDRTILDPVTHRLIHGDRTVDVSPTEFRLLAALIARPGHVVRRAGLVATAWPNSDAVQENSLDAYVGRLRRKLREAGAHETIETVRGVGYRWNACGEDS